MPRRRTQSQKRGLIIGTIAVVLGFGLLFLLSYLSGQGEVELSNLGDRDFAAGDVDRLSSRIARDDRPFLFADASPNRARPIYLDHGGGPPTRNWLAVLAMEDGCAIEWNGDGYTDCEGTTYPRSGEGLTRYRTYVEDDIVYVDLRTELP